MKYFFGFILYGLLTFGSFSSDKAEIAKILKQSTVYISLKKSDTLEEFGIGSGVVINRIKNKFYILTNSHVILFRDDNGDIAHPEEMGYDIWVHPHESVVSDNLGSFLVNEYLYWDDEEGQDYAILMIDFDPWIEEGFDFIPLEVTDDPNFLKSGKDINDQVIKKKLSTEDIPKMIPIKIGSSFELNELDTVYAAGYPMIAGNFTDHSKHIFITSGEINSFITEEKDLEYLNNYSIVYRLGVKGGMSGGPVVNSKGELIAINGLTESAYTLKEANFKKVQNTSTFVPRVFSFFIGLLIDDSIDQAKDNSKQVYIPEKSVYDYGIIIEDIIAAALLDNDYNKNPNSSFYNYLPYSKIPKSEQKFFNSLMEQNNISN